MFFFTLDVTCISPLLRPANLKSLTTNEFIWHVKVFINFNCIERVHFQNVMEYDDKQRNRL